jgi:hypothetical protein
LKLAALKADFDTESQTFLADYDQVLEDWITKLPEFEAPIRRAIEPASVVAGRLRFGFQLMELKPAEHAGTFTEEVQGLGDNIFSEVEQMAHDLEGSFEGKDKLHRKALGTFKRIRDKLACLSFIDPRIQPVVDTIDDWVSRVPTTGPIEGGIFNEGLGLALLLSEAERMARHGAGQLAIQQGNAPDEELEPEQLPFVDFDAEFAALFEPEAEPDEVVTPSEKEAPQTEATSFFF